MAFERFSPRKSTSALRCWWVARGIGLASDSDWAGWFFVGVSSPGGSPGPSSSGGAPSAFGWKLFIEAQAFTRVPSIEKCSSDRSGATSRCTRIASITLRDISVVSSESRFFVNTVRTQTRSSMPRPTNQRNSRLYCICSINCRSDRTENRICSRLARISRSGAIEIGVQCFELGIQAGQRVIHHLPDHQHIDGTSTDDADKPTRVLAAPCPCCGKQLIIVETIPPAQHSGAPSKTQRAAVCRERHTRSTRASAAGGVICEQLCADAACQEPRAKS